MNSKFKVVATTRSTPARSKASNGKYIKLAIVEVDYSVALYCPGISSKSAVATPGWRLGDRSEVIGEAGKFSSQPLFDESDGLESF